MTGRRRRGFSRASTKSVLVVLFIASVDRDSMPIDQEHWTSRALALLGQLFGGATAFPRARGVWRDDARSGRLVWDEPVVIHCYAVTAEVNEETRLIALRDFCLEMCASTNQGEVGLVIDNRYHALSTKGDPA